MKIHEPRPVSCDVFVETSFGPELLEAVWAWAREADQLPPERYANDDVPPQFNGEDIDWGGAGMEFRHLSRARLREPEFGRGLVLTVRADVPLARGLVERFLARLLERVPPKLHDEVRDIDGERLERQYGRDAEAGI